MIHTFHTKETRFLSNFFPIPIKYKNADYASVEAAYMSAKSEDVLWKSFCQDPFNSPGAIKNRSKLITIREDWADIKLSVMEECLRCKFSYPHMIEMLLATGNQNIVEGTTWNDRFWGVDLTETPNIGENHLGRLLMKIRDELVIKKATVSSSS